MARNAPAYTGDHDAFQFAPLTEADIKAKASAANYTSGRAHVRKGHIQEPCLRGNTIDATCIGASVVPFEVQAVLAKAGDSGANPSNVHCTCSQGGYCQHVVALLLTWVNDPLEFEVRLDIDDLLGEKSREQLIDLVRRMVQRYPELEMPTAPGEVAAAPANVATVKAEVIRRQVRSGFMGFDHEGADPFGFGLGWGMVAYAPEVLDSVMDLGDSYTAAEQWANAQVVFSVLAEEVGDAITQVSDREGHLGDCLSRCDEALSLCLDTQAELPDDQRLAAETRLRLIRSLYDIWRKDVYVLGNINIAYYGPAAIARAVTDSERAEVEDWLQDEPHDGWGQHPRVDFIVTLRQETGLDDEGILAIYRDAEMWAHVADMLLSLDRVDEAVTVADHYLKDPSSFLGFAGVLIERGGDDVTRALSMVDDRA